MDQSLDELIKKHKRPQSQRAPRRPNAGINKQERRFRPAFQANNRPLRGRGFVSNPRPNWNSSQPQHERKDTNDVWKHDMFMKEMQEEDQASRSRLLKRLGVLPNSQTTTTTTKGANVSGTNRVKISNLHYEVTDEELKSLFSSVGKVEKLNIQYDSSGRSNGIAFITYSSAKDAQSAIKQFNAVKLFGQPIIVTPAQDTGKVQLQQPQRQQPLQQPTRLQSTIAKPTPTQSTTTTTSSFRSRSYIAPVRPSISAVARDRFAGGRGRGRGVVGGGRAGLFTIRARASQTVANSRRLSSFRRRQNFGGRPSKEDLDSEMDGYIKQGHDANQII
eukprot:TRINITY_DN3340_c0_g1_i1.p1 TRINITY_DN3340_c0_g1~~TRINITY_DN3340_c0_g1_i1.p1  ORF type:complete len:332 (+),score=66.53 TRINITY_DN3340_c0_g1_i1:28-1023(+)